MDLITVTQKKDSHFQTEIRNHIILSDMSVDDGGNDESPSPAEHMVSALGACIGMTINTYCETLKQDTADLEITMTYVLNNDPKMIKNITVDIAMPEGFPESRHKAVMNLLKACPIYNSLHPDIEVDIEIE